MFGIYAESLQKILEILQSYPAIDQVLIYGSRANGNFREGSDIDLTFKGKITSDELDDIRQKLDDSFIPYIFDLSRFKDIKNQNLLDHINRVGTIFYKK